MVLVHNRVVDITGTLQEYRHQGGTRGRVCSFPTLRLESTKAHGAAAARYCCDSWCTVPKNVRARRSLQFEILADTDRAGRGAAGGIATRAQWNAAQRGGGIVPAAEQVVGWSSSSSSLGSERCPSPQWQPLECHGPTAAAAAAAPGRRAQHHTVSLSMPWVSYTKQ
jgi:hypothetical protein